MSHLRITFLYFREYDGGGEDEVLTDKTNEIFTEAIETHLLKSKWLTIAKLLVIQSNQLKPYLYRTFYT